MSSFLPSAAITSLGGESLAQSLALMEERLRRWAADGVAFNDVLRRVYGVDAGAAPAEGLRSSLLGQGLGLSLEVAALPGQRGAYAAATGSDGELVLLDRHWLVRASAAELESVLLEELGHALDWRLNGALDSPGDEGEIFSALLRGEAPSLPSFSENDHRLIEIGGQPRLVEAAVLDATPPTVELNGAVTPTFAGSSIGFGLPVAGRYAQPVFADIDGDGDLDAFIGNDAGQTIFFRNSGSATAAAFAASSIGFGLPDVGRFASPAFADIDADGDLDAFIGDADGNTVFMLNSGSATAAAFAGSSIGFGLSDVGRFARPTLADIDGDGDLDAFIGDANGNTIFFLNSGSATAAAFAGSSIGFGLPSVGISSSPAFADIDGDGDLDAFIGDAKGTTYYFQNTGRAQSAAFAGSSIGFGLPDVGRSASPTFADIDGDGDLDAFIGDADGNTIFFLNSGGGISSPNANGIYGLGRVITIQVPFSEAVLVDTSGGVPSLLLETGNIDRVATYSGGSGTRLLSFTYTVQSGDSSADLDYSSSSALQLNGSTIKDSAGNDAILSLPVPGSAGSLAANAALVIDGLSPAVLFNGAMAPAFAGSSLGFGLGSVGSFASPTFADIDADGDLDAFIGNFDGSTIFFLNSGSSIAASFADSSIGFGLSDVGRFASPTFADIDSDGDLDAFIGSNLGNTFYFENTGSDSAPAFVGSSIGFGLSNAGRFASPSFADIDGDGDLDAFIGNVYGDTVFFENTGTASSAAFAGSSIPFNLPSVGGSASPTFADIDADGDLDAFIGNYEGNTFYFQNTGNVTAAAFAASSIGFGLPDVGLSATPVFADIDADGDLDAFIGNSNGSTLFFRNTGGGVISTNPNGAYGPGSLITIEVPFSEAVLVDTSGGVPSLLLETGSTDRPAIYSGGSGTKVLTFTYTVQPGDSSIDLDYTSSSALLLNGSTIRDAAGNSANPTLPAPGGPGSLGANAALVIDTLAASVPVNGAFTPAFAGSSIGFGLPDVGKYAQPVFADIDADGDLDAFIGNNLGQTIFFLNSGSATAAAFAASTFGFGLSDVGGSASPELVDIDADGDLDAFIGDALGNTVFFLNSGSATAAAFATSSIGFNLANVGFSASPTFADIDADGDLDAFIGNKDGNTLYFLNTGSASAAAFAGSSIGYALPDVGSLASPALADIDSDGDLDVFIGNGDGSTLYFMNTGNASHAAFAGSSIGFGIPDLGVFASPTFADIDGDGDLDAFIGDAYGNTVFFRNTGGGVTSTNPNGAYGPGSVITIEIAFSETVVVDTSGGVPSLLLETGSTDRAAIYSGGSGTRLLIFSYTVQPGDSSVDLDYTAINALQLNGGTIKDSAGNNATPSLPAPGAPGSLGANANLVIYSDLLLTGTPLADTLNGGFGNDTIIGLAGDDSLNGFEANDSIIGGDGNDTLIGGSGIDTMDGGAGNDFYFVDTLADQVIDSAGNDTINATLSYTLPSFIEHLWLRDTAANGTGNNLDNRLYGDQVANILDAGDGNDTLRGAAGDDTLLGGNGNDTLQGDTGNDSLSGSIGNDSLDGGVGADTMDGGDGNDTYYVDTIADQVVDSAGSDTINSTISYVLPSFIEHLWLRNTAARGTGNSLSNRIYGNAADNFLDGAVGADNMRGAAGNDTYIVDNVGDTIVETNASGSGLDTVYSSVTYTLSDNVERILLTGSSAINATGNALDNLVFGNSAANILTGDAGNDDLRGANGADNIGGGDGNDVLRGQLGNDTLTGGTGADRFRFDSVISGGNNVDLISDFRSSDNDLIDLDQAIFTTLNLGSLPNSAFINGSAFTTADQRILFNGNELFYDPDGTGSAASERFATTTAGTTLRAASFVVISYI